MGDIILSNGTVITASELAEIAGEVKKLIAKESKEPSQYEEVQSLANLTTLPALLHNGLEFKLVRVAVELLNPVLQKTDLAIQWKRGDTGQFVDLITIAEIQAPAKAATDAANVAATKANTAAANADTATGKANEAATSATSAASTANKAADRVDESILDVSTEKEAALKAAEEATAKVNEINTGLARLEELEGTLTAKDRLQPTSMKLTYPKKITFGNTAEQRIEATLSPAGTGKNVLFLSDNRSVQVMPDGFIRVLNPGKNFIHIIPTENTAIYQTVEIEVLPTPIRLLTSTAMRLNSSGVMRLG